MTVEDFLRHKAKTKLQDCREFIMLSEIFVANFLE
eukprot:CAMPEP_0194082408 /NCGR_PEP_ID=MMETSP0149-20130528/7931_1 /TAXON_ID=122233 /ORGANISM="Chaetoceros debilis, Strain MM31A-1" /LENGTH=34 /DNA_ID= /DNA_START= /DNA_END= /DNA_ORIENTATION=